MKFNSQIVFINSINVEKDCGAWKIHIFVIGRRVIKTLLAHTLRVHIVQLFLRKHFFIRIVVRKKKKIKN